MNCKGITTDLFFFFFPFSDRRSLAARHYLTPIYGQWVMVQLAEFQVPQLVARSQPLCHRKWCHLQVLPRPWSPSPHPITNKSSERQHLRGLPSKFAIIFELYQLCANSPLYLRNLQDSLYWLAENENTWWVIKANSGSQLWLQFGIAWGAMETVPMFGLLLTLREGQSLLF